MLHPDRPASDFRAFGCPPTGSCKFRRDAARGSARARTIAFGYSGGAYQGVLADLTSPSAEFLSAMSKRGCAARTDCGI